MITKPEARKLWADLKNNMMATEESMRAVIRNKAWEPLGYGSFSAAWSAEMSGITLASEIRPHVAFYMFQEGYGPDWVANHLKGVSKRRAVEWRFEWEDGVTPDVANRGAVREGLRDALGASENETVVEPHVRKKPGRPAFVRFEVGTTWYREYQRIAASMGTTVEDIARSATEEAFRTLVKNKHPRSA